MTKGDSSKCKCPSCKKEILNPCYNNRTLLNKGFQTEEGTVSCPHCKCKLYFWSGVTTYVHLEKESKVK